MNYQSELNLDNQEDIKPEKIKVSKKQEIHEIFKIVDKEERIKKLVEYTKANFQASTQCKANILNEAHVIFDGKLL